MSQVLSQSEVDALLAAVSEGELGGGEPVKQPGLPVPASDHLFFRNRLGGVP